ncbi:MAG: hypothetical protein IKY75_04075 [Bacteroidaceae bacterium]|nr:hypothetical protein [Bacteroidaceae bacterium]
MKTSYIKSLVVALIASCTMGASAQALHSSYFLDGMVERHELNPAFGGEANFIALPGLSGFNLGVSTNFGLSNFVFQKNGELVLGLSSQVSATEFLGALPQNNQLQLELDLPILSFGFRAFGGFNTFSIKERTYLGVNVPSSIFAFLKQGADPATGIIRYDIDNLGLYTDNYLELALGHSRKLPALEGFSYGAKLKFLVGAFMSSIEMQHIGIEMSQNRWMVESQGSAALSSGLNLTYDADGNITGVNTSALRLGGYGMGVDLGAVYTPAALPNLTVSLAVNDIGFISWSQVNSTTADGSFEYTGFGTIGTEGEGLNEQLEELLTEVSELIQMEPQAPQDQMRMLQTTLNVGAEYAILDRKISFGILSSTRFGAPYTYAEGMAVVSFRPASWFQAAINGSVSTQGSAIGALLTFCPNGANIFFGCDYVTPNMKFSAEAIPLYGTRVNLRTGIIITFGKKK